MTAQDIRQMDGPALTRLAWVLHLEPHDPVGRRWYSWQKRNFGEAAINSCGDIWQPHERIDQADAVFRTIRARGWDTANVHPAAARHPPFVAAIRWEPQMVRFDVDYGKPGQDTEALALLRCAVLAMASAQP